LGFLRSRTGHIGGLFRCGCLWERAWLLRRRELLEVCEYSGNTQGNIQGTIRKHFKEHSGNIQGTLSELLNVQETYGPVSPGAPVAASPCRWRRRAGR